ncbi:hypothetical protein C3L33_07743, partial [Rhododendron williamsianum]
MELPPFFHAEKDDFWKYIPLYQAALRGDWATAETIFTEDQGSLTAKINEYGETALHVAAGAGRSSKAIDFVKRLVAKMSTEAVTFSDQNNCTPLHLAAWAGNKEAAKVLLKKQPSLLYIRENTNFSALDMAARNAKKDTLVYLLAKIKDDDFSEIFPDGDSTAHFLILLDDDSGELVMKEETTSHIGVPCIKKIQDQKKMHLQALKLLKCLCVRIGSLNDSDAYKKSAKDALLTAAKLGIHEVMEEIVESFPNLLWAKNKEKLNLFQIAVKERHAGVFNLIYQMGDYQEILVQIRDDSGNNLLHLAGRLGPEKNNMISGAALQMQRELQWFEVILCIHLHHT